MAAQMSRAFGISVRSSFVKFVPTVVVDVSTTGDSPVTVTDLLQRCDAQLCVDRQRRVDHDSNAFALEGLETLKLEVQDVRPGRKGDEAEGSVLTGDLRLGLNQRRAGGRNRHTR